MPPQKCKPPVAFTPVARLKAVFGNIKPTAFAPSITVGNGTGFRLDRAYGEHPRQGKTWVQADGYEVRGNGNGKGVTGVHRDVMSQSLGRPLDEHETVHHKNGIRGDNRIENLELWSTAQPTGGRVVDKLEWARWFIKQYETTKLSVEEG